MTSANILRAESGPVRLKWAQMSDGARPSSSSSSWSLLERGARDLRAARRLAICGGEPERPAGAGSQFPLCSGGRTGARAARVSAPVRVGVSHSRHGRNWKCRPEPRMSRSARQEAAAAANSHAWQPSRWPGRREGCRLTCVPIDGRGHRLAGSQAGPRGRKEMISLVAKSTRAR